MAHFARLNAENKVVQIIVAEPDFIQSGVLGDPEQWVQYSYNTRGGVHYDPETGEPSADQSKALRYNAASITGNYDPEADAFYHNSPYPSWTLNTDTYDWEAPIPKPTTEGSWRWDEANQSWYDAAAE